MVNDTTTVEFNLNKYATTSSTGTRTFAYYLQVPLNLTSTYGNLSSKNITLNQNNRGNVIFTGNESGYGTVTAKYLSAVSILNYIYIVPEDSFMALNLTIARNYGKVLNLTHNYTYYTAYDTPLGANGVLIKQNITINGNGSTLDAITKCRILTISGNDVILNNISYVNGALTSSAGGAIYSSGINLFITKF